MSGGRRSAAPVVSRAYRDEPEYCIKAIQLLLKTHAHKEGGPAIAAPDDPERRSDEIRAKGIIPE